MANIEEIKQYLKAYDGDEITLMEVCGSHTAAIAHLGIKTILSDKIKLLSGPGCPVCVTPSSYIDKLIELAKKPDFCVVTFGDLIKVPGSKLSLAQAKGEGANVIMVYSPLDILKLAKNNKNTTYVFAAVGFETTTPIYTLLLDDIIKNDINNILLLTALKTMPQAIRTICESDSKIDGFIAPGHVSVITGSKAFEPLAKEFNVPFSVTGFNGNGILMSIYGLIKSKGTGRVLNLYKSAVHKEGNKTAIEKINKYFEKSDAVWRGLGKIKASGLVLKGEYKKYDAGSYNLEEDIKINKGCKCDKVLIGKISSAQCPLFGKVCTPDNPQGACMVSGEGSCNQNYIAGK